MAKRELLVVGSNIRRPDQRSAHSGRVQQAATILGFEQAVLANLFAFPTYRSGGIADLGRTPDGWLDARSALASGLDDCDGVLLAVLEPKAQR